MELISLYYFSELSKTLHVTRTAERLFISQQTLSNHIARLESYYGTPLLNRKPCLSLTPAGEQVLAFANAILREEDNLKAYLFDIEQQERGLLRFGASTLRMNSTLPHILPDFTARYPKVELRLTDTISSQLVEQVLEGQLDLAVAVSGGANPRLTEECLMDDRVYLCVADSLLRAYYGDAAEDIKRRSLQGASVRDFAKLPFCLLDNRIGERINECFAEARVAPHPFIRSTYTQISSMICFRRLAAAFIPHVCLADQRQEIPADINIFPLLLNGQPLIQQVDLIQRKGRYCPRYFTYFRELLQSHFQNLEQLQLERIAKPEPA